VSIHVYPGAYHSFDHPNLPVRQVKGLAYTEGGTGTAHTGTHPAARADALHRVPDFLAK
jgi:dienelactone hydrolase